MAVQCPVWWASHPHGSMVLSLEVACSLKVYLRSRRGGQHAKATCDPFLWLLLSSLVIASPMPGGRANRRS